MNWESIYEEFCRKQNASTDQYSLAIGGNNSRHIFQIEQKRKDALRAMDAVKEAYEKYPNSSPDQLKREAKKLIAGNPLVFILLQVLLSATIKLAIDYFVGKLFETKSDDAALQVSPK
jgi:hypothetical protein